MKINEFAMNGILPNITFILMLTPEQSMQRILANKEREINRLDKEQELQIKVYNALKSIINNDKTGRIIEIDASKSVEEVKNDVINILKNRI